VFEDLRQAFREALDNFKDELNRDAVPGTVDRLLHGMVQEVTEAKSGLKATEADLAQTRLHVRAEEEHVATTSRRHTLATQIGDQETARIAGEYRERHAKRLEVFRQKEAALEQEVKLLSAEVEEMMAKVKEARSRRDSLTAESGRTQARESIGGESDDLFDTFKRMEAKIQGEEYSAEAAEEVGRAVDDLHIDLDAPPTRDEIDYDAVLAELKRRMGQDSQED
jgi:phage shock protein A